METSAHTTNQPHIPRPRTPGVDLDTPLPRHWFAGNVFATHVANGVNLLFPAGERFFVRSVNRYLDRIESPILRAQIKGFFGQEGRHAKEHERFFVRLEEQGFNVQRYLQLYEAIAYRFLERVMPAELSLSTTAACEHFTAIMAENALRRGLLEYAHPSVRDLLKWHAAEEIEHRAVAFDVLQEVNPSYALRIAGLGMATLCLGGFWMLGTLMLLAQDDEAKLDRLITDRRKAHAAGERESVFISGIREYLRPDFHPSQKDTDALAAAYLAEAGLA